MKGQYKMDMSQELETQGTQYEEKHNTICVGHRYTPDTRRRQTKQKKQHNMCTETNTNNVNKFALL